MLNLLLGRSGSGKSHYLREISEEYINNGKPVLVLVPEQFSFETGLYFLNKNSKATNENVKVLSFSTLKKYVFSLVGGVTNDFLDEGISKILMSLAIEECSDQLQLYEKQVNNKNFVDTMLTTINEYKSSGINSTELLSTKAFVKNPTLKQKLEETACILDVYSGMVNQSYVHTQDILSQLAQSIAENGIFKGYTIFIDAFTGFTNQQYKVLKSIISQADDVYFSLSTECIGNSVDEKSIRFRVTVDTYHRIRALALECSKMIKEIYSPFTTNRRTDKGDLRALEKSLYAFPINQYDSSVENVSLYSATNIYNECEYIARTIKLLTIEQGYRYKDIAIVCRDESLYRGILDVTLEKFGIGYFMDKPENINAKPMVNFIRHCFDSISNGFNSETVIRILKTGITKYSYEDISVIENYIFVWTPKWSEPFTNNINGFGEKEMTESDKLALQKIESIRNEVYSYLKEFQLSTQNADGLTISKQISILINQFGVKEKIKEKINQLNKRNSPELVDEYTRVWNSIIAVVSKMAKILEDKTITAKRYYELFSLAINCEQIANQPLCIDRVIIGTAGRARLNSPKVTFVIGAVQGVFPSVPSETGVFTDNERQLLLELGLPLSCGLSDLSAQEQFSAYSSVSSPSEKLYISYYTNTVNGGGALPSTIVTQVQRILPELITEYNCDVYDFDEETLWCAEQAFEHTVANIKEDDPNKNILEKYFLSQDKYKQLLEGIYTYKEKRLPSLNKNTAHMLYSENMRLSASRIDDFYNCAYMYFCKNGLKLRERRKATVDSRHYGSLVHYIMEKFLKLENIDKIIENRKEFDIISVVKKLSKEFIDSSFENGKLPDNKTEYTIARAEKSCTVLIKRLLNELAVSEFRPSDFELSIGIRPEVTDKESSQSYIDDYKVKTKDGTVSIVGFVDRVDLYKSPIDGKTYVRIVDYKTGIKDLKRCDMEMGLNLQMFIYLSAIMKGGNQLYGDNLAPAGVCYMPAKEFNTTIKEQGNTELVQKIINNELEKHYKAKGLFLRDPDVILAMDSEAGGKYIPVRVKFDKKKEEYSYPYSEEKLLSGDQYSGEFKGMFDLVDDKIRQMSDMLLDGYIASVPTGKKSEKASLPCNYCSFKNSCVFTDGMEINVIPSSTKEKEDEENG